MPNVSTPYETFWRMFVEVSDAFVRNGRFTKHTISPERLAKAEASSVVHLVSGAQQQFFVREQHDWIFCVVNGSTHAQHLTLHCHRMSSPKLLGEMIEKLDTLQYAPRMLWPRGMPRPKKTTPETV